MRETSNPPVIAVIGCDGSGKSTVCEHLIEFLSQYGPAARVHLGKQAGNVERQLVKIPVLGKKLGKKIDKEKRVAAKSQVGLLPALVIMSFVLRRLLRFRRMLKIRERGFIILADRFPQTQIPGAYDGPALPENNPNRPFISWLASREHQAFRWMAGHQPDLVLKLHVDVEVAFARKPDHRREALAKKVAITARLVFPGSQVVDIDVNQPLTEVLSKAERAVADLMHSRGYPVVPAV
ncbi:thymidylate kinase [Erwinia sp. SLM-02]|uniref:thymidylate kinase n=1 Tax=Erwinia sp. SLM-02 TaxID=3020057 RepID=UPI00307FE6CA